MIVQLPKICIASRFKKTVTATNGQTVVSYFWRRVPMTDSLYIFLGWMSSPPEHEMVTPTTRLQWKLPCQLNPPWVPAENSTHTHSSISEEQLKRSASNSYASHHSNPAVHSTFHGNPIFGSLYRICWLDMFEFGCENCHRPRALIFALLSIQGFLNIRCKYPLVWLFLELWTSRRDNFFHS